MRCSRLRYYRKLTIYNTFHSVINTSSRDEGGVNKHKRSAGSVACLGMGWFDNLSFCGIKLYNLNLKTNNLTAVLVQSQLTVGWFLTPRLLFVISRLVIISCLVVVAVAWHFRSVTLKFLKSCHNGPAYLWSTVESNSSTSSLNRCIEPATDNYAEWVVLP